ncbi:MAG: hypothetical protein DDT22_00689 [candidate division WS2 bacterium]|nr:hypothetical protein [Candidatus Lithacetigena glycinireducens]MBT9175015.1 hypothetical protein [Candidatus Lithacetigena glycinireducens]
MDLFETLNWTIKVAHVTGNSMFDYFFTLVMFFGLLAFAISIPIRLLSRS